LQQWLQCHLDGTLALALSLVLETLAVDEEKPTDKTICVPTCIYTSCKNRSLPISSWARWFECILAAVPHDCHSALDGADDMASCHSSCVQELLKPGAMASVAMLPTHAADFAGWPSKDDHTGWTRVFNDIAAVTPPELFFSQFEALVSHLKRTLPGGRASYVLEGIDKQSLKAFELWSSDKRKVWNLGKNLDLAAAMEAATAVVKQWHVYMEPHIVAPAQPVSTLACGREHAVGGMAGWGCRVQLFAWRPVCDDPRRAAPCKMLPALH
jgi:hypothetical protein